MISKLKSTVLKISGSGLNVSFVPVLSVSPIATSGAFGTPRAYSWSQTLPSRFTSSFSDSETAFTALTPTP